MTKIGGYISNEIIRNITNYNSDYVSNLNSGRDSTCDYIIVGIINGVFRQR